MIILLVIGIILALGFIGGIIYNVTGLGKGFYHDILNWHKPTEIHIPYMGISFESKCKYCGEEITQDSQGNWF